MPYELFHSRFPEIAVQETRIMMKGSCLGFGPPQGKHADEILKLFKDTLLPDKDYIERVKRHYRMFRSTVDKPSNPLLRRRRPGG